MNEFDIPFILVLILKRFEVCSFVYSVYELYSLQAVVFAS